MGSESFPISIFGDTFSILATSKMAAKFLACTVLVTLVVAGAQGLKCYGEDKALLDIIPDKIEDPPENEVTCDNIEDQQCYKYIQKSDPDYGKYGCRFVSKIGGLVQDRAEDWQTVARGLGADLDIEEDECSEDEYGSSDVEVVLCLCSDDLCNSAVVNGPTGLLLAAVAAAAMTALGQ